MIKAYLTAVPTLYEGEDIEVRYRIFQNDTLLKKETRYLDYRKPAVVSQASVLTLLQELEEYKEEEIVIVINDASLHEVIKGNSTTKNGDIINMAVRTKKQLKKFASLSFSNVTKDREALAEWKKILEE